MSERDENVPRRAGGSEYYDECLAILLVLSLITFPVAAVWAWVGVSQFNSGQQWPPGAVWAALFFLTTALPIGALLVGKLNLPGRLRDRRSRRAECLRER